MKSRLIVSVFALAMMIWCSIDVHAGGAQSKGQTVIPMNESPSDSSQASSVNADVLMQDKMEEFSRKLRDASKAGRTAEVKAFIAIGVNKDSADDCGYTALVHAAERGHSEVVNALLEAGADASIPTKTKDTALLLAARWGHIEIVNALLNNGVDIDARNCRGNTPLIKSICNKHVAIANVLLDRGADVHIPGYFHSTAVMAAISSRQFEIASRLIERGDSDLNHRDCAGRTPLHLALWGGRAEERIVTALLKKGVNVNVVSDPERITPLMLASENGDIEIIRNLLQHGADLSARTIGGNTALHFAAKQGANDVVKELLERRADMHLVNNDGETALSLAVRKHHAEVVGTLLAADLVGKPLLQTNKALKIAKEKKYRDIQHMIKEYQNRRAMMEFDEAFKWAQESTSLSK